MAGKLYLLTAKQVVSFNEPGRYADGGNLYVQVTKAGTKSWLFMYRLNGRQREMGLGSAAPGAVTLAEARDRAAEARKTLLAGQDPIEVRKAAEAAAKAATITFGSFADSYVKAQKPGWKNAKHAAQWEMTLGDAYCRDVRSLSIGTIGVEEVLGVLKPIWLKVPETARRIRMRIEKVLDAAKVQGLRSGDNPARWRGHLDHLLAKHPKGSKRHHKAMPYKGVSGFMAQLRENDCTSALALEFAILTATRTSEVINAEWPQFDLKEKVWTFVEGQKKEGRAYRVPLSDAALAVLQKMKGRHAKWVFPGEAQGNDRYGLINGKPLSNMAMLMLLKGMGYTETVHGFRSTFRDWVAEETSFPNHVAEMALAHSIGSETEAAYRRGDLFEKRRKLMDAWARYAATQRNNVVPLKTA